MSNSVTLEVIGLTDSFCGPFSCNEDRTCELEKCHPAGVLIPAFEALKERIEQLFGETVDIKLTLLDNGIPDYIEELIEERQPPLPIILVNGNLTPIGRISLPMIKEEIEKYL